MAQAIYLVQFNYFVHFWWCSWMHQILLLHCKDFDYIMPISIDKDWPISHLSSLFFHRDKLEEQSRELERLRKQLSAKEEVERRQIDAVCQLNTNNQRLEQLIKDTNAENAELEGKMSVLKTALDTAYKYVLQGATSQYRREWCLIYFPTFLVLFSFWKWDRMPFFFFFLVAWNLECFQFLW